ncbi:MAG: beta-N-acetylglucosaminidase domain-containing protein [candidate division WOR-3 bacterium]|nr:MAG: beta-N-acetylglucosaminidase domain-containing protein [candidate division WOR-3 bacterium]
MTDKVFGVVEGFYRRPYSLSQRLDLIDFLQDLRLNTYIYGPKADSFHRKNWQKPYPAQRLKEFERMKRYCEDRSIDFVYALSPVHTPNIDDVVQKISTMTATGIVNYSIFFDDIVVPLTTETARLQLSILHALHDFLNDKVKTGSLSFCPTQYRGFKKTAYITYIAENLRSGIDIFWTGKTVVARSITEKDIARITQILRRPVLIWDNLFANDYIPGTIIRFPYRRRSARIITEVRGILINPMNNYRDSKPLIHTAAQFFHDPHGYAPRKAWRIAMQTCKVRP